MYRAAMTALFVVCCCVVPTFGQAVSGSINGYVTDNSGASIAEAVVVITNEQTGIDKKTSTDSSGFYNVTSLVPGQYSVAIQQKGFSSFLQKQVALSVDATVRVDATLQLGTVSQTVTVAAGAELLQTEKSDVSETFNQTQLASLPIINRNITQLYADVPGAVVDTFQMGAGENPQGSDRVYINGTWSGAQEFILDGISDLSYGFSGIQLIDPPVDSVQEVKITTADYDPEFGSTAGMVAQYVTKSGTNEFHGSIFYYNRNSDTFAADPLTQKIAGTGSNGKGLGVAPFNWNQGGLSAGGPIKRNKLFIFGDYQLTRTLQAASILSTVPNNAFRSGDFSAVASSNPIYDPSTGNADGSGRQQISCGGIANVICPSRISPVANNLLALLPSPNISQATDNNYVGNVKELFNQNEYDTRGDWNVSDHDMFFARYSYFTTFLNSPPLFGIAGGPTQGGLSPEVANSRSQQGALNYTHTFGAGLLSELRAGVVRFHLSALQYDAGSETNNQVGIPGINTGSSLTDGLAGINIGGPVGSFYMGIPSGVGIPRFDGETTYEFVNNWTKTSGGHQLRWGADVRRHQFNFLSVNASSRGNYQFCQTVTGIPGNSSSGIGMATFLLGDTCEFDRAIFTISPAERQTQAGLYIQDIWRANKKLTLSYGLRWDWFEPVTAAHPGGLANFDPATGDILLAGLGSVSNSANVTTPKDDFAPRVGLAYKLTQNTVIRSGFGRNFFSSGYDATFYHLTSFYPIIAQQQITQTDLYQSLFPLSQAPPAGTPPVLPSTGILPAPNGTALKSRPFNWKTEQLDSWNFTIEQALGSSTTLSAAYVGTKGTHLSWSYNMNAAPAGFGPLLQRRPFYAPYGLSQGITMECNCSDSNYNALQLVAKRRLSSFWTFASNFSWSKSLGYDANNPYNRTLDYGVGGSTIGGSIDRAVTWTFAHTIKVPYGSGFAHGSNANGVTKLLLSNWVFSGITSLESGLSFTPTVSSNASLNGDFTQLPNRVPGANPYSVVGGKSSAQWYNPAAFSIPICCQAGDASVGMLRGPGVINADWSLAKNFRAHTPLNREATMIEFRAEVFNAWNNKNLGLPIAQVDQTTAGRITDLQSGFPMRRMQFGIHVAW
jgi:outer membrane receptor protein involved in Fe transport